MFVADRLAAPNALVTVRSHRLRTGDSIGCTLCNTLQKARRTCLLPTEVEVRTEAVILEVVFF